MPKKAAPVNLVVSDVIDLHTAGAGVSQDHVVFAAAREVAETHDLPIQTNRAQEAGVRDQIVRAALARC